MIGGRALRLISAAMVLLFLALRERARGVPSERSLLPRRLHLTLERLGPTFVKAGQALSLRQDLLPEPYLLELQKLQSDVAPFPAEQVRREIESALGKPVSVLFSSFKDQPLAAASIAQVHSATLADGRRVIVKVRRPRIRRRIDRDMRALVRMLRLLTALSPTLTRLQPSRLAKEIWCNLQHETDFRLEARAMNRLSKAFEEWPGVEMPAVVEGMVSESVLVQAMSEGRLLGDPSLRGDGKALAETLIEFYLHQIFVLGFFHADPHPGNLFFTARGTICFHDFGLVGQLDRATRRELAMFVQAFVHQDARWMLDAATTLGLLQAGEEQDAFVRGIEDILADYAILPLKDWSLAEMFLRVSRLGERGSLLIPYNLLVLMRALFLVESALRKLDPEMNVLEVLADKGREAVERLAEQGRGAALPRLGYELAFAAREMPAAAAAAVDRARKSGFRPQLNIRLADLEDVRKGVERTGNRLAMAIVTLGLYVGSSLLMLHSVGPRLLGVPLLALAGYLLALWYTVRLARAIARSGHF